MSRFLSIAPFRRNAVVQLIAATGVGFVVFQFMRVCLMVYTGAKFNAAYTQVEPWLALPPVSKFGEYWWTILTYGWVHRGFMEWLGNIIWLYTFGNVVQMLIGHRHVIPAFIYALIFAGLCTLGIDLILPASQVRDYWLVTSGAGVAALAGAAMVLAPRYRFWFSETFSIPIWIVFAVYVALNIGVYAAGRLPLLMLGLSGLAAGAIYAMLVKRGYKPGAWMYNLTSKAGRWGEPGPAANARGAAHRAAITGRRGMQDISTRIDDILEKIHLRGYDSLSQEEKDILLRASKED